jgi:hypothetical protein
MHLKKPNKERKIIMGAFSRKSAIPKTAPRLRLGYSAVRIKRISRPTEVMIKVKGRDVKRHSATFTFEAMDYEGELDLDVICFLTPTSRLSRIFGVIYDNFDIDHPYDNYTLEAIKGQRLIVFVVDKASGEDSDISDTKKYSYRTIDEFRGIDETWLIEDEGEDDHE